MAQGPTTSSATVPSTPSTPSTSTTIPAPSVVAGHDSPIVLDLGSKSRKQIKRLRKGGGKLMNRVNIVLEDLRANGNISPLAQPVIVVVKERKADGLLGIFD